MLLLRTDERINDHLPSPATMMTILIRLCFI